jgi:hypothetical protein
MSAGSGASNLGYSEINPINTSSFVNGTSSNYSGSFSSNEIPNFGLAGTKSNIDAAAGKAPGICLMGGAKKIKRKIKNITKQYKKMKHGSKKMKSLKNKLKNRSRQLAFAGGAKRKRTQRRRRQRGGYSQYQNNMPMTPTYSVGGILSASELGLANPPPIHVLPNSTNGVDNYNHYTNEGYPSRGN